MLLGLEPGYRGPDDRLDRSILAGVVAILGTGMSFLVCMLFLIFPDWITPRDFVNGVRTFVARVEVLSAASASAASVTADDAWATNGAIGPVKIALTRGFLGDPSEENLIQTSRHSAEKAPTSIPMGLQPGHGPARDPGKSTEGLREETGVLESAQTPEPNSYVVPDESHNATQAANTSSQSDYSSGTGSPGGYGSSGKGKGTGKHP